MPTTVRALNGLMVVCADGMLGRVRDAYVDEQKWAVRYLVVEAGTRTDVRKALISPLSILAIDWPLGAVHVIPDRRQIMTSPATDSDTPPTRDVELALCSHYAHACYWGGCQLWGESPFPASIALGRVKPGRTRPAGITPSGGQNETCLRSANALIGRGVDADGKPAGQVRDLLFHEGDWSILFIVVDASSRAAARILLPPHTISRIGEETRAELGRSRFERGVPVLGPKPALCPPRQDSSRLAQSGTGPHLPRICD